MAGLKKAGKALKEAYQNALPGKGLETKSLTVSHTTHDDDGSVAVHISGPEKDIADAYKAIFPGDTFSLPHPEGATVYTATVDKTVDGDTHKLTIHHHVTTH